MNRRQAMKSLAAAVAVPPFLQPNANADVHARIAGLPQMDIVLRGFPLRARPRLAPAACQWKAIAQTAPERSRLTAFSTVNGLASTSLAPAAS